MTEVNPLFFSTFMYAACKVVGAEQWDAVLAHHLHPDRLDVAPWHGLRTLGQAIRVGECRVHVDAGTYIDKSRCVAAGEFLYRSGADCDVWLTCDDDVFAEAEVIERLVENCRETKGLVALPYMNRDGASMTFRTVTGPTVYHPHASRSVDRVGMGLVAMHRDFVSKLARKAVHFRNGPNLCPYLFTNGVENETFIGEDFWLCMLAEKACLPMHVLLDAPCQHMNLLAKLDLEGRICVQGDAHAEALERGITSKRAQHASKVPDSEPVTNASRRRIDG